MRICCALICLKTRRAHNEAQHPKNTHHSYRQPAAPGGLLALITAKEAGTLANRAEFDAAVRDAVGETVRKQIEAGVDVINDGEMSKPGYSTYVKDRSSGFEGESTPLTGMLADIRDFPEYGARLFSQSPAALLKMPACNGPIRYRDTHDLVTDIANLKAATVGVKPKRSS